MKDMNSEAPQPLRILIAALGGEGGGVLAGWITEAAIASGLTASRTSIPGVAQRTGATTYYIELVPSAPDGRRPVLALNPAPGLVDVLLCSEPLEAARLAAQGMISPERTVLICNTARTLTMDEKMAMADGRVDTAQLERILRSTARRPLLTDLRAIATESSAPLSAILLGALAAAKVLPLSDDAFRTAIRSEDKAVERNLVGFEAGRATNIEPLKPPEPAVAAAPASPLQNGFAPETAKVTALAVDRLSDYQNSAFADLYVGRVRSYASIPGVDDRLSAEFARQLALRMCVEDVIRVAQLKLREARLATVNAEARAKPGDIVDITEFLKPGPEEILGLLPPALGRLSQRAIARLGLGKVALPMTVTTTRFSGYLRLKVLAGLKRWRPRTLRFAEEQAWCARWIDLATGTARRDPTAAREVIATARLVRGYGQTYKRGLDNWTKIMTTLIEPVLSQAGTPQNWSEQILQARLAAEKDPEGDALAQTLAAIERAGFTPARHSA
jgi:indolepyruvate ferredoxin oxidoreductase, beta subunit